MSEPNSVYPKLAAVMAEVEHIPKRGYNKFHKYDYALAADVLDHVRGLFNKHGLVLVVGCSGHKREIFQTEKGDNILTSLDLDYTIVDPDTGDGLECAWAGEGMDKGDKGIWKAMTGGEKYFFMQTFLIPTGDDPEADDKVDESMEGGFEKREDTPPPAERDVPPADTRPPSGTFTIDSPCHFPKHKGKPWRQVCAEESDYVTGWVIPQSRMNQEEKDVLAAHLEGGDSPPAEIAGINELKVIWADLCGEHGVASKVRMQSLFLEYVGMLTGDHFLSDPLNMNTEQVAILDKALREESDDALLWIQEKVK